MGNIQDTIINNFGNKLRVRVCGICLHQDKLLMINHIGLNANGFFWAPPGGGLKYGESIADCLKREFKEETNLEIEAGEFLFFHEFLDPPLHAVELFFKVNIVSGKFQMGSDPELSKENQIIQNVEWLSKVEILDLPKESIHQGLIKNMKLIEI